jgi:hypothetical protein
VHGRDQQHDRQPPELAAFARLASDYDALLYVDDAHGFGVIGERSPDEPCPYGRRGNGVVRHLGQTYDNLIISAGSPRRIHRCLPSSPAHHRSSGCSR